MSVYTGRLPLLFRGTKKGYLMAPAGVLRAWAAVSVARAAWEKKRAPQRHLANIVCCLNGIRATLGGGEENGLRAENEKKKRTVGGKLAVAVMY
jgi:hypothetical protein